MYLQIYIYVIYVYNVHVYIYNIDYNYTMFIETMSGCSQYPRYPEEKLCK